MLLDIFKKYMNIFTIIGYIYILYSYDFKTNIPLLLVITGIFIFLIYNNKPNIEKGLIETFNEPGQTTNTGEDLRNDLSSISDQLNDLSRRLENYDESRRDDINERLNNISNLFSSYSQGVGNIQFPDIQNIEVPEFTTPTADMSLGNLQMPNIGNIEIPENILNEYRKSEIPKLKKRIELLEEKLKELDSDDKQNAAREKMKSKIMDLEIQRNKWEQKMLDEQNANSGDNVAKRKIKSYASSKGTTPMGMYDGMCLERFKKENIHKLGDEKEVNTFLGTTMPLKVRPADNTKLDGPSVDGNEKSPKRLNMFEVNKTSISCCEDSPYLSTNGCVCLTSDQNDYLVNRGGNHEDKSSS